MKIYRRVVEILVVQRQHKYGAFDRVQSHFVQSFGKEFLASLRPWNTIAGRQSG